MVFEAGRTFNTIFIAGGLLAVCCYGSDAGPLTVVREVLSSAVESELIYPDPIDYFLRKRHWWRPLNVYYENNLSVAIKISAPVTGRVSLNFTRFEFQDQHDYVQVLDSLRPQELTSTERLTGSKVPEGTFTSNGSTLYIGITTDESDVGRGFVVRYKTIAKPLTVVQEVQSSVVERELSYPNTTLIEEFSDPHFGYQHWIVPANYANNLSVAIKISAPAGARVVLNFTRFQFDQSDHVQVLDSLEDVDSAERMTGSTVPEGPFTSAGSTLYIGITTDENLTSNGFAVCYRAIGPVWTLPDIVQEVNSSSSDQQFLYPTQTGAHSSRSYSVVKVSAPLGKRVRLSLSRASLGGPNASYVQLLDSLSIPLMETQPKLRDASDEVFVSKSNAAFVLLNSTSPLAPADAYNMSYLAIGCVAGDCDYTDGCEESFHEPGYTCTCPPGQVLIAANGFCLPRDSTVAAIYDQTARLERKQEQLINLTASSSSRKEGLLRELLKILNKK